MTDERLPEHRYEFIGDLVSGTEPRIKEVGQGLDDQTVLVMSRFHAVCVRRLVELANIGLEVQSNGGIQKLMHRIGNLKRKYQNLMASYRTAQLARDVYRTKLHESQALVDSLNSRLQKAYRDLDSRSRSLRTMTDMRNFAERALKEKEEMLAKFQQPSPAELEKPRPLYRPRIDKWLNVVANQPHPVVGPAIIWFINENMPLFKEAEDECERLRAALQDIVDHGVSTSDHSMYRKIYFIAKEALEVSKKCGPCQSSKETPTA